MNETIDNNFDDDMTYHYCSSAGYYKKIDTESIIVDLKRPLDIEDDCDIIGFYDGVAVETWQDLALLSNLEIEDYLLD